MSARLEAMLISKFFCCSGGVCSGAPSVVASDQPFFDPGASTSVISSGLVTEVPGSSLVQTTGEAATYLLPSLLRLPVRERLRLPARVLPALLRVLV